MNSSPTAQSTANKDAGLYQIELEHHAYSSLPKIDLLHSQTGVPVFVLYLHSIGSYSVRCITAISEVENEAYTVTHENDKKAWRSLKPFFEVGGTKAIVLCVPYEEAQRAPLEKLIGIDQGFRNRSGLHLLKQISEHADLVIVPQASELLTLEELKIFYSQANEILGPLGRYYFLFNLPKTKSLVETTEWLTGFNLSEASVFFPWLYHEDNWVVPSVLAAGAVQLSDKEFGIAEMPSNRLLNTQANPLVKLLSTEVQLALDHRITLFHRFNDGSLRLWGGRTLADPMDLESRFLSARRTLLAVKDAVERLCEPFVLEPMHVDLPQQVDVALQSAFHPMTRIFDSETKKPFHSQISLQSKNSQDVLHIEVSLSVPFTVDRIHLSTEMGG